MMVIDPSLSHNKSELNFREIHGLDWYLIKVTPLTVVSHYCISDAVSGSKIRSQNVKTSKIRIVNSGSTVLNSVFQ